MWVAFSSASPLDGEPLWLVGSVASPGSLVRSPRVGGEHNEAVELALSLLHLSTHGCPGSDDERGMRGLLCLAGTPRAPPK